MIVKDVSIVDKNGYVLHKLQERLNELSEYGTFDDLHFNDFYRCIPNYRIRRFQKRQTRIDIYAV
jgi:hypothetical protein